MTLELLRQVDHTLAVHGHIDAGTELHKRIANAIKPPQGTAMIPANPIDTLKAMLESPYEQPIGTWFYAIQRAINAVEISNAAEIDRAWADGFCQGNEGAAVYCQSETGEHAEKEARARGIRALRAEIAKIVGNTELP